MERVMETSNNVIRVIPRNVYGTIRLYPGNARARLICEWLGKRTLDKHDLEYLKRLGFVIQCPIAILGSYIHTTGENKNGYNR